MRYELWESTGVAGSHEFTLLPEGAEEPHPLGETQREVIWTVEAASFQEAMRLFHEHMDWEPYVPFEDRGRIDAEVRGARPIDETGHG